LLRTAVLVENRLGRGKVMFGALVLRMLIRRNQASTLAAKDIEALKRMWADDVMLTFMRQPPIVGREAVENWYQEGEKALLGTQKG
jgi:ketosteroid isomerase-like protein